MDEPIYRAALETQTDRGDLRTQWGKEKVGWIGRVAWHIYTAVCRTDSPWWKAAVWHRELSSVLCDDLEGWGGARIWAPLVAQMVKNPPAMRETWVRSWGPEDPLEKGMATHSSILAWRIPWTEEPGRLQSMGLQRVQHDWAIFTHSVGSCCLAQGAQFSALWWPRGVGWG